jgi:hypothetical protein
MNAVDPNGDELRLMVRELLREALPSLAAGPVPEPTTPPEAAAPTPDRQPADHAEVVALRTDGDLDRFVRRLLTLFENPKHRADLRAGRLRFTLGAGAGRAVPGGVDPARGRATGRSSRSAAIA